jgi:hypothetical protein
LIAGKGMKPIKKLMASRFWWHENSKGDIRTTL